jgi:hypothetical protein
MHAIATKAVRICAEVSVVEFNHSSQYLSVRFSPEGYWLHRGGIYGKGPRTDPLFQWNTRAGRIEAEIRRVSKQRQIETIFAPTARFCSKIKQISSTSPLDILTYQEFDRHFGTTSVA